MSTPRYSSVTTCMIHEYTFSPSQSCPQGVRKPAKCVIASIADKRLRPFSERIDAIQKALDEQKLNIAGTAGSSDLNKVSRLLFKNQSPDHPKTPKARIGAFEIAHDRELQARIDSLNLPWGIVWELARHMTIDPKENTLTPEEFAKLDILVGPEATEDPTARVSKLMGQIHAERKGLDAQSDRAPDPFEEARSRAFTEELKLKDCGDQLLREETALLTDDSARLGCSLSEHWYGGNGTYSP